MRWLSFPLAIIVTCASSSAANAWDPFRGEDHEPEPSAPVIAPDPAPFIAPPPGVYYVTETYVADVVTTNGPLTTYATTTIHESTGSYARVLETVGTGVTSLFDGAAFNGRRSLTDGRSVAGTYYQNYILTTDGFVPLSVVFFQDDAELARLGRATPPPSVAPAHRTPSPVAPTSSPRSPCCAPAPAPSATPSRTRESDRPITIRPGVSLVPAGSPLSRIEVLRGREVSFWLRAFADDREIPVNSWSLTSGEAGETTITSGTGSRPFRTSWTRLPPPGAAYELTFRLEVHTPTTGQRLVDGRIAIVVRAPALEV